MIWSLAVSGMLAILLRPIVTFFEDKLNLGRMSSILLLYLLVIGSSGSAIWFLGGEVISQTREFIGSAADWPAKLEAKAKKSLPPETWEAFSEQAEVFKEYWKDLLGPKDPALVLQLEPKHQMIYDSLGIDERETFRALDSEERMDFLELAEVAQRKAYLGRKNLEMRNQAMEVMEKQGGQIAEKSAEVLKSAWSGLLGLFAKITYLAVIPIYLFYFP